MLELESNANNPYCELWPDTLGVVATRPCFPSMVMGRLARKHKDMHAFSITVVEVYWVIHSLSTDMYMLGQGFGSSLRS